MPNAIQDSLSTGTLTIVVHTAGDALPVPGATVTVTGGEERDPFFRTLVTDANGRTAPLRLATPAAADSLSPGAGQPYAVYRIHTQKPGFYQNENRAVSLFAGVASVQPVELLPLPPYESGRIAPTENTDFTAGQQLR